jgi:hypothetical protein
MGLERDLTDTLSSLPADRKEEAIELLTTQLDAPRRSLRDVLDSIDRRRMTLPSGRFESVQIVREGREER